MGRWITRILLLATGVTLAFNVGRAHSQLASLVTRNFVTIALTEWLHTHAPAVLLEFEQDFLFYFNLSPYVLLTGVLAGLIWSWPRPLEGVLLLAVFAACFSAMLIRQFSGAEDLAWYECLDVVLSIFALIPIFVFSANIDNALRTRSKFQVTLQDCLLGTALLGILFAAIVTRWFLSVPFAVFLTFSWLAWRTLPRSQSLVA